MTNFDLIEQALDRQSAAIIRMAQRQPHVQYNHNNLWDLVDAAKKELRESRKPTDHGEPETVSNEVPTLLAYSNRDFEIGHYDALPKQVVEQLRSKGVPVIGDWMVRGVEYGELTQTYRPGKGVVFVWHSLGEEPFDGLI